MMRWIVECSLKFRLIKPVIIQWQGSPGTSYPEIVRSTRLVKEAWHSRRFLGVLLIIAALLLVGCAQTAPANNEGGGVPPARVERIAGTDFSRVILTAGAAKRIGIETAPVGTKQVGGTQMKVVPYSAILYDLYGETWVYTNPAPLTYVRAAITVDSINRDTAVLSDGPPIGTLVVTVGVVELYGSEFEGGYNEF